MSLRLHDTATGAVRDFTPRTPGRVGFYLCGATVQSSPHIGHLRSAIAFDVLRRWLEDGHGLEVTFVRNVTDIDDKVLARSAEAGQPWWAWAYRYEQEFEAAYDAVGVRRPTYLPRATGHVPEMVELVEQLIERGHAYRAPDGGGDVWFDVRSWPGYGSLTHQRLEDLASDPDADARGKRDPRDFALWKGHKPGEPETAAWPTPFGRGRPGWHLECSAMARRYLGPAFDLHAGGLDLRFPHHENEQAQSRAAGDEFAGLWLHNGWVRVGGQKMGKSLGNSLVVDEVLATTSPLVLRYALGAAHYRSMVDHGPQTLADAEGAVGRIEAFLRRAPAAAGGPGDAAPALPTAFPAAFRAAMDDDLNVPVALAALHDAVRAGNRALDAGDEGLAREHAAAVTAMARV
ncbi:MAG: Cysteinyl-tRNA synthetase, partial [uncultured Quadrisphaera sp.]